MIFLGLGSNLGDRQHYLQRALELLERERVAVVRSSSFYETEPVDMVSGTPRFLNMVVEVHTSLDPIALLLVCQNVERVLGRRNGLGRGRGRGRVRYQSRVIDIDLLFYGDRIMRSDFLILPHPKAHERFFVLEPMKEIAPDFVHPVLEKSD